MTAKLNTWYEARLVLDSANTFRVVVWERDNPSVWAENTLSRSSWSGQSWGFKALAYTSGQTVDVEFYEEAKLTASGLRTGMTDGSGSTAWQYDTRRRMTSETKTIDAVNYLTSYTYNSADLPVTMAYPDGEILTYTYHNQMLLNRLSSNIKLDGTSGTYYYVQDTTYDASGRVEGQDLSATSTSGDPVLVSDYNYNPWTVDAGRMIEMISGTFSDPDSLLDLHYDYDADGNIVSILDETNSNQKQCYGYDALHRLTSAAVGINNSTCSGSVGDGEYANESYTYNSSTGNLASKTGQGSYTYSSSQPYHGVSSTSNGNSYSYDANGNMTSRTVNGTTYTLTYDYENRLVEVKIGNDVEASFTYDGDGVRVHGDVGVVPVDYVGSHYEYSNQTEDVPEQDASNLRHGVDCYDAATGSGYLMYSAESVHERFSAYPPNANNADHFICVKYTSGVWKYDRGISPYYYTFTPRPGDVLVAAIDFTNDTITSLQGTNTTENGIDKGYEQGELTYTADRWNGQTDDGEFTVGQQCSGPCTSGPSFTPNRRVSVRKYYYWGSTRVAMRENGVVKYLFGDHLGSTSIVSKANGSLESRRLYKPWGETRYGTTPATTFGFTGQREEKDVAGGLYFYEARWYDESLGRWLSPDSIIPAGQGVQAYDRYAYVNNSPTNYNDPTGHCILCVVVAFAVMAVILTGDTAAPAQNYPINGWMDGNEATNCPSSLAGCFGDAVGIKDFSGNGEDNPIPIEEFDEFAGEVAEDLYSHDLSWPGYTSGRGTYDTPFYNGGGRGTELPEGIYPSHQQVCIETLGCYARSDVNYIAQGMWGAATNEGELVSETIATVWKLTSYRGFPSDDAFFWIDYGYQYYKDWVENQND